MFESQPSFWIKIEMNITVIIGYGWHHISLISLYEAVELYWHKLNTLNGVTWNICRGYILQFKINVKQCLSISIGKKKIYICGIDIAWIFFIASHIWQSCLCELLSTGICQSIIQIIWNFKVFLSLNLVWMSKSVLSSACLFICKTKLKTLTEWTVSGPEGGIAITPVGNTEYHPLLEGGGATGCGIDRKVEPRKISEKYHFLIDQWHCMYSLKICIKYNIE